VLDLSNLKDIESGKFYDQFESAYHEAAKSFFATQTILTGVARESLVNDANNYASLAALREVLDSWTKAVPTVTTVEEVPAPTETPAPTEAFTTGDATTETGGVSSTTEVVTSSTHSGSHVASTSVKISTSTHSVKSSATTATTKTLSSTDTKSVPSPTEITGGGATPARRGMLVGVVAVVIAVVAAR